MSNFSHQLRFTSSSVVKRIKHQIMSTFERKSFTTTEGSRPTIVHKRNIDILHDPWFNKGTAFSMTERDRLDLRGLLPPGVMSSQQQIERFRTAFSMTERDRLDLRGLLPPNVMSSQQQIERFMVDLKRLEVHARDGPADPNALAKWRILNRLHDRNETMYYKVLIEKIEEYAPIVYTPTVGLVCQNYSGLFRRPRGMYFSAEDRGEMMSMVYNWPADQVDMIVVTDGSRILGLGDLGVQGIGIAIGKLDLYVAAAGLNPQRTWGYRNTALKVKSIFQLLMSLWRLFFTRWPHVIVQFEDFQSKWAFNLLQRYRNKYRMFNDDVQGTAGVAIAGLLGAVRAQGKPMIDFPKQKIVLAGAGSAGIGVANAARKTMARMLGNNESAFESARSQFWVVDANGLITEGRKNIDPQALPFARTMKEVGHQGLREGASLEEVGEIAGFDKKGGAEYCLPIVSIKEKEYALLPRAQFANEYLNAYRAAIVGVGILDLKLLVVLVVKEQNVVTRIKREGIGFLSCSLGRLGAIWTQPLTKFNNNLLFQKNPKMKVRQVKPDVLLGLSAVGGLFSNEVLEALKGSTSTRPAIFAMSNPTKNAECTPEEAFSVLGDQLIFASGSPFNNVDLGNGLTGHCNQGNNMYLFPGIGLGKTHFICHSCLGCLSDYNLRWHAGKKQLLLNGKSHVIIQDRACLAAYMKEEEVLKGVIYPSISSIRNITKEVASAVVKEAIEEDLAEGYRDMDARELRKLSKFMSIIGENRPYPLFLEPEISMSKIQPNWMTEEIETYVKNNMWEPAYPTLVYRKE
ncbi:hypothetical protein IFM89_036338 [Coptis chinensis]|uniref:Malic enzyme n=1 Tax=Coptis chinensis TaxID=261450 RepID=A0A835IJ99_9MAGN|nr:hypothetical protein IFM89_036338 [Coptis chinensis]